MEKMKACRQVDALDRLKLAEEAGSPEAVNLVLMGRCPITDLPREAWMKSLEACVPMGIPGAEQVGLPAGQKRLSQLGIRS